MSFSIPISPTQQQHPRCLAVAHLSRHPQGGSTVLNNLRSSVINNRGRRNNRIKGFYREK